MAVFCCADRLNCYFNSGLTENLAGKIIPADITTFVTGIIDTISLTFYEIGQQAHQVCCVSGGTDLIVDYPQDIVRFCNAKHCLDKVGSGTKDPGNTDDEIVFEKRTYRFFWRPGQQFLLSQ